MPASPFAFDPAWLETLVHATGVQRSHAARFEELYLERRLDIFVQTGPDEPSIREIRTEGMAARWTTPSKTLLAARTGLSAQGVRELLDLKHAALRPARPRPAPELDPPRAWKAWAATTAQAYTGQHLTLRLLIRRAAVVRPDGWRAVEVPVLLRMTTSQPEERSILTVWGHPELGSWIARLMMPPPHRVFSPLSGTRLPVVLGEGTAGAFIHELIGHLTESDLAVSGLSPLGGLGGAEICPVALSITDDPTRDDLPGSFSCDDEGIPAQPLAVVRDGRLTGWLCDRHGARILGQPPGRGRRASWATPPVARMSNIVVKPGTESPESIERGLQHALVVTGLGGATIDASTGRVVLRVTEGFEIRNGRRRRALAPLHLTGSVIPLLTKIDPAIGNDPTPDWRLGWCVKNGLPIPTGSEAPSMLIHGLEVL